jgi:hypothetical protein
VSDPRHNHIVLRSQRVGELQSEDQNPSQVAERAIVIK